MLDAQRQSIRDARWQELYVNRIGVPRRNRDDQGLIRTVEVLSGPAVGGLKVLVHAV